MDALSGDSKSFELRNMVSNQVDGNVSLGKKSSWLGRAMQADVPQTLERCPTHAVLGTEETS